MGTMLQDLRFGLRMLAKNPGFTAVAVVTLALGIGANTAIFSVIDAMWLRPLPVKEPRQLIQLATVGPVMTSSSFSYPAFKRFR
ncbi:MAG: ABC transporter permease, partial [Acidobacteria bacterium]